MLNRRLYPEVTERLENIPAVAILGPRQAGKTTLALQLADQRPSLYLDLQLDTDRAKLDDPAPYLLEHSDELIVLDDWRTQNFVVLTCLKPDRQTQKIHLNRKRKF